MVLLIKKHLPAFHTALVGPTIPLGAELKLRGESSLGLKLPQSHSYISSHLRAFLSTWNLVSGQAKTMQHLCRMIPAGSQPHNNGIFILKSSLTSAQEAQSTIPRFSLPVIEIESLWIPKDPVEVTRQLEIKHSKGSLQSIPIPQYYLFPKLRKSKIKIQPGPPFHRSVCRVCQALTDLVSDPR